MTSRPCGVASSARSESMRDTIAVELIATVLPSAMPICHDQPNIGSAMAGSAAGFVWNLTRVFTTSFVLP